MPKRELYCGMLGYSMYPRGRKYSWLGTRDWEVRNLNCKYFLPEPVGVPLTWTSFLSEHAWGRRRQPSPVITHSLVCISSINYQTPPCPNYKFSWVQLGQLSTVVHTVRRLTGVVCIASPVDRSRHAGSPVTYTCGRALVLLAKGNTLSPLMASSARHKQTEASV